MAAAPDDSSVDQMESLPNDVQSAWKLYKILEHFFASILFAKCCLEKFVKGQREKAEGKSD